MNSRKISMLVLLLCVISVWQFGSVAYIHAKAELAQYLVERAWREQLVRQKNQPGIKTKHANVKPWPWADTWPVARLEFPRHDNALMVLAGATGSTLAFAPGWMKASALPGGDGVSVIAAHRDTHFSVLKDLHLGDDLIIHTPEGFVRYRVVDMEVVDSQIQQLNLNASGSRLLLITCYPFNALVSGGRLRYVVSAEKISQAGEI